ncbi:hypothetical protein ACLOJK_011839 [Asimina triloba]
MSISTSVAFSRFLSLLFFLLSFASFPTATSNNKHQQSCFHDHFSALLQLKRGFRFHPFYSTTNLSSWTPHNRDCCSWEGISCDGGLTATASHDHVTHLDLTEFYLFGQVDFQSIFSIRSLKKLSLANNRFDHSPIPSGFAHLTSLTHLDLSNANFYGKIPSSIGSLTSLVSLDLSCSPVPYYLDADGFFANPCKWKLEISPSIGSLVQNLSSLRELDLSWARISSGGSGSGWSRVLALSLPRLRKLGLRGCGLSGPLHSSLSQLHFLSQLDLSYNNLSSLVPDFFGNFSSLTSLELTGCQLYGPFPKNIFILPALQTLDVSENSLVVSSPEFPPNSTLQYLDLSGMQISGKFPDSFKHLKFLTGLGLYDCSISGPLPSWLANLTALEILQLSSNNFSGPIPSSYGSELLNLRFMEISGNQLSGSIPSSLFSLPLLESLALAVNHLGGELGEFQNASSSNLEVLLLGENSLQGAIPSSMFELGKLSIIYLSLNNFSGVLDLGLFGNMKELTHLELSDNSLSVEEYGSGNSSFPQLRMLNMRLATGQVPPCLGETSNFLRVVNLRRNNFNGSMLQTFKKGCRLQTIDVNGNKLGGQVPRSLGNCKKLEVINLGNNQLHDTFPFWLGNLSQLRVLILRSNKLHGSIAHPLTNPTFSMLQIMDLSSNDFTGNLPSNMFWSWKVMIEPSNSSSSMFLNRSSSWAGYYQDEVTISNKGREMEIVKILTAFTVLDLSNNKFRGSIPASTGDLKSLRVLNMSYNDLEGGLPASLGNVRELESLDLSNNRLSGEIPWQLTKLTFLSVLDLSQNLLVGSIPQSQQFLTFPKESFLGNLGLCGFPLPVKCEEEDVPNSPLPSEESESELDWDMVWIGLAVGFAVGWGALFWTLALWRNGRRLFYTFADRMLSKIFPCAACGGS